MLNRYICIVLLSLLSLGTFAQASSTRAVDADSIKSSDHSKTFTLPGASTTMVGRDTTDTLSGKSIDGTANTLTKLPVAVDKVQEIPSGSINGSNVTFTLTSAPAAGAGLYLTLDGLVLLQGAGKEYTISGSTITFATAPATGQALLANYHKY